MGMNDFPFAAAVTGQSFPDTFFARNTLLSPSLSNLIEQDLRSPFPPDSFLVCSPTRTYGRMKSHRQKSLLHTFFSVLQHSPTENSPPSFWLHSENSPKMLVMKEKSLLI